MIYAITEENLVMLLTVKLFLYHKQTGFVLPNEKNKLKTV